MVCDNYWYAAMNLLCTCDPATKRCRVCGVEDLFCGSARACPAPSAVIAEPPPVEQMPTRSAPGFLEKVRNFATAAAGHVAAGMPMASDEEIIRRHDICLGCEHLQDNACTQCGCPVARVRGYVSKLSWADSECPVGKWGKAPPA